MHLLSILKPSMISFFTVNYWYEYSSILHIILYLVFLTELYHFLYQVSSFETVAKHGEEKEKVSFSQMPSGCDESDFNRWRNCMHRDFTINRSYFLKKENVNAYVVHVVEVYIINDVLCL